MIKQVELKGRLTKFIKVLNKLNDKPVDHRVKTARSLGFNLRLDDQSGIVVGYACKKCGRKYRTTGWLARHNC